MYLKLFILLQIIYTVCERLLELAQKGSSLRKLSSKSNLKNLDKTLSTIKSHSKSTQDTSLSKQKSKDSLNSADKLRRDNVMLGNTRDRFRSISLEDLPNSEFKDVLDEADSDSGGSGNADKLSRDTIDDDNEDDNDDDNSIVFGHSAADLKALANQDKTERTLKAIEHRDSGLSTISSSTGCSEWTVNQENGRDLSETSVRLIGEALSVEDVPDTVLDEAARLEVVIDILNMFEIIDL